jgi:hypothetical protein
LRCARRTRCAPKVRRSAESASDAALRCPALPLRAPAARRGGRVSVVHPHAAPGGGPGQRGAPRPPRRPRRLSRGGRSAHRRRRDTAQTQRCDACARACVAAAARAVWALPLTRCIPLCVLRRFALQ